jgi:peptidoglycan/LPS O-acetylase OafA/YrhL
MTGRASYGRFMRRRVVRIYPAFLTVLAIYLALSLVVSGESKLPAGAWAAALYLAANVVLLPGMLPITPMVTVAWSLSYEMFYYLTIPLLVGAAGLRRWTATARIRFFVALLCFQLGLAFALGNALHVRLGMFIPGILLYEVLRLPARPALSRAGEGWACLLFVLSFVPAYWLTAPHTQLAFLPRVEPLRAGYKVMVLSITYLVFLLHVFVRGGLAARVFSWTPLRWLGNMSYSYYLIHGLTLKALAVAVMHVAPPAGHAPLFFWSLLPVGLLATLAVSTALFLGVEKPLSLGPVMPPRRAAPLGAAVEAAVVEAPAVETTAVR